MTETAKAVIDRLQGEAGHATGGEVDRLVFSGLDVHTMLNEIEQAIDTDKLSVEKLIEKEIEDYEESYKISGRRSENYIAGILEGLKIARAHVIDSLSTDKLSVEKLQEHLLPYSKEMVQKIRDEKMQLVTADEFLKLHKESLTAIRENDKLQEQLNTAKKYIEHVIGTIKHDGHLGTIQTDWILPDLEKALAAIGGDDEL